MEFQECYDGINEWIADSCSVEPGEAYSEDEKGMYWNIHFGGDKSLLIKLYNNSNGQLEFALFADLCAVNRDSQVGVNFMTNALHSDTLQECSFRPVSYQGRNGFVYFEEISNLNSHRLSKLLTKFASFADEQAKLVEQFKAAESRHSA